MCTVRAIFCVLIIANVSRADDTTPYGKATAAIGKALDKTASLASSIRAKNGLAGFLTLMDTLGTVSFEIKLATSVVTFATTLPQSETPAEKLNEKFKQLNNKLDVLDQKLGETIDKVKDEFKLHDFYKKRQLLTKTERDQTDFHTTREIGDLNRFNDSCKTLNAKHTIYDIHTGIMDDKTLLNAIARSNNFELFENEAKIVMVTLLRAQSLFAVCSQLNYGYANSSSSLKRQSERIAEKINEIKDKIKLTAQNLEEKFPSLVKDDLKMAIALAKAQSYQSMSDLALKRLQKTFPNMEWLVSCGARNFMKRKIWPYKHYEGETVCAAMNASASGENVKARQELDRCLKSNEVSSSEYNQQALENAFTDCLSCGYFVEIIRQRAIIFGVSAIENSGMSSSNEKRAAHGQHELSSHTGIFNVGVVWKGCVEVAEVDTKGYGCYKGYCWSECTGAGWPFYEWCYTTRGSSQDYNYVKCNKNVKCKSSWNCAGSCTI